MFVPIAEYAMQCCHSGQQVWSARSWNRMHMSGFMTTLIGDISPALQLYICTSTSKVSGPLHLLTGSCSAA